MNLKCVAVSAVLALTMGGSFYAETKSVANEAKFNSTGLTELVDEGLSYDITPADKTVSLSTAVSSNEPNTFMQAYFSSLNTNMGENYKGSCGYVAIGMLLSYYDTFLSDTIIPEQYDVASMGTEKDMVARHNSPGIYNDVFTKQDCAPYNVNSAYDLSATDYFSLISKQVNYSLHAKLISIGEDAGNYDYKSNDSPAGTTYVSRMSTLCSYLWGLGFSTGKDFSVDGIQSTLTGFITGSSAVKQFVQSYIDKGYPVLVSLENSKTGARHACIAYSYDENDVYVNMGWSGGNEHVPVSSRYDKYTSAMILDWKIGHTHSNNYGVSKKNIDGSLSVKYYCYDDSNIVTSGHRHIYSHNYEMYDSSMHKAYCSCGQFIYENHSFSGASLMSTYAIRKCRLCDYFETISGGGAA